MIRRDLGGSDLAIKGLAVEKVHTLKQRARDTQPSLWGDRRRGKPLLAQESAGFNPAPLPPASCILRNNTARLPVARSAIHRRTSGTPNRLAPCAGQWRLPVSGGSPCCRSRNSTRRSLASGLSTHRRVKPLVFHGSHFWLIPFHSRPFGPFRSHSVRARQSSNETMRPDHVLGLPSDVMPCGKVSPSGVGGRATRATCATRGLGFSARSFGADWRTGGSVGGTSPPASSVRAA